MNSEKENPIVEIRSAEDAAKWVGRDVRIGWRGRRDLVDHWYDYKSGVLTHTTVRSDLRVHLDSGEWLPYTCGDPIIIRLLDGAAHPRPDGDGWAWCETSEQAARAFAGVTCEADMAGCGNYPANCSQRKTLYPRYSELGIAFNGSAMWRGHWITSRGGAWIRPAVSEPAKTPEREAADALEIESVAADDAVQAASAYAADLHRELRNACREADEADERDSRTKADALWVLPDGWGWGMFRDKIAAKRTSVFSAFVCYVSGSGNLSMRDTRDDSREHTWAFAPFAVIETVIARYRAENPE